MQLHQAGGWGAYPNRIESDSTFGSWQLRLCLSSSKGSLVRSILAANGLAQLTVKEQYALPFRTGDDAMQLRQHLRECLQRASQERDVDCGDRGCGAFRD